MDMIGLPCRYQYALKRYQGGNRASNNQQSMTKSKRTNNELQNTTQKAKDWAALTPLKPEGELGYSGKQFLLKLVAPVVLL